MGDKAVSLLFLLCAWSAITVVALTHAPAQPLTLWLLIVAVAAGLPHGALDVILLRRFAGGARLILGLTLYAGVSLLVIVLWRWTPGVALGLFLAVSWFHFGVSDTLFTAPRERLIEGVARGGAPLVGTALFHPQRVVELFTMLVPHQAATLLVELLQMAAPLWMAALLTALAAGRRQPQTAYELVTLVVLFLVLPPLPAFSLYFALLHAPRSITNLQQSLEKREDDGQGLTVLGAAVWPTLATLVVAGVALLWLQPSLTWDIALVRVVFIGLAALTFPHVILWLTIMWHSTHTTSPQLSTNGRGRF